LPAAHSAAVAAIFSTLVGAPEVVGGPTCCLFDSPFLGLRTSAGTVGLTANSDTRVFSLGASVSNTLPAPLATGLSADADAASFSHCGKWLNAAFVDDANTSVVHGFFHQEWHCDYADGLYTNKSVGYARSDDGGLTFAPAGATVQLIAGNNFSTTHQCGEGDHGVVRLGDDLYMLFIEWDGPSDIHGGTTAGLARSSAAEGGAPGTWLKWFNGTFAEPGVGGRSDIVWVPGTAVYSVPAAAPDAVISIGVIFSAALEVAWSGGESAPPLTQWTPAVAGPLFNFGWSEWNRNANSSELIGYPGLTSDAGAPGGELNASEALFVYFTYLAPGEDFTRRWLVRRPLRFLQSAAAAPAPPTALAALSVWASLDGQRFWATSGPVTPSTPGNFSLDAARHSGAQPLVAYMATSALPAAAALVAVAECELAGQRGAVALTLPGECGSGAFAGGAELRLPGWLAPSATAAAELGWDAVRAVGGGGPQLGAQAAPLWRCRGSTGAWNYSAGLGGCDSAGAGFVEDAQLGYALSALA
jgi:hypothetical protein